MSVLHINNITNKEGTSGPVIAGIATVSSTSHLVVPTGHTGTRYATLKNDPYYEFLELALPFSQDTEFFDVTGNFGDPRKIGDVTISSAQSKFYTKSVLFDGTGDGLQYGGTKKGFGTGDFTIECWIYRNSIGTTDSIIVDYYLNSTPTNNDIQFYITNGNKLSWFYDQEGAGYAEVGTTTINASTWYHVAVTRKNGIVQGWLNGTLEFTDNNGRVASLPLGIPTRGWWVGIDANDSEEPFHGHIQDLRVYNGVAKYTSNFTPPNQIAL